MADNRERLIFSLEVDQGKALQEAAKLERKLIDLREERKRLNKEIRSGNDADGQSARRLAAVNVELQQTSKALRVTRKETQAGNKTYNEQANTLSVLTAKYKAFQVGVDGTADDLARLGRQINTLNDDLKAQDANLGNFQRNVGDYKNAITDAFDSAGIGIGNITAALSNPVLLAGAVVSGVIEGTKELVKFVNVLGEQRAEVERLTGATGEALDRLNARLTATASTFGVEFTDTLQAANALAREYGITVEEAAQLQQTGFALGADATGQFNDILREYSVQAKEAGLSGEEFIGIVSQSITEGVFSDKGIDAIKEAQLRLREMPQAAQDALQAIGLSSTEISNALADGTRTTFDVIREISARLGELPPQSREVGQAIAGIFGGPGEDAGLRFLTTIKDIEGGLDGVVAGLGEAGQRQLRLADANTRLNKTWNDLLGSSSDFFQEVKVLAVEFLANFVERSITGIENLINGFIELNNGSRGFRTVIQSTIFTVKSGIDIVSAFFNVWKEGLGTVAGVIKAVLTRDFASIPDLIREGGANIVSGVRQTASDLAENYADAYNKTVKPKLLESFSFGGDADLAQASQASGQALGGAFVKGYGEIVRTQIQGITEEAQTLLNQQLAENDSLRELRDNIEGIKVEATQSEKQQAEARAITNEEEIAADKARIESARSLAAAVKQAAGERAEASQAAAVIEKLAAAAEIGINLQREISAYWANTGVIPGVGPGIATALSVAAGIRAASALAQLAGFAEGGYTSGAGIADPRLPGRTITGYVHDNEYVVPTHVMQSPAGFAHVRALEGMRLGLPGYASGGFTGTGIASNNAISQSQLTNAFRNAVASMPQPVVAVTDINRVGRQVQVIQNRANQ